MREIPNVTEARKVYEEAYGEMGVHHLLGKLYAHVPDETLLRFFDEALEVIRENEEAGTVCVYCYGYYPKGTAVCPTCYEYDGMMTVEEAKKEELI